MLFNEVYGAYYSAVSAILAEAVSGKLTGARMIELITDKAFAESIVEIPDALKSGRWPLLDKEMGTPLKHVPRRPLTTLEKRWLKSLLLDPRIALFDPSGEGLEDVEPLYTPDMLVYYDRYSDGDNFSDPKYIENFRAVLRAMNEGRKVRIKFVAHRSGQRRSWLGIPYKIEYSSKDDKFRLIIVNGDNSATINFGRMKSVQVLDEYFEGDVRPKRSSKATLVLELTDERNALERVMLHFSHLDKQAEKTGEKTYRLTVTYDREDETDLLIRVLSFGRFLRVVSPADFANKVRERVMKQTALNDTL